MKLNNQLLLNRYNIIITLLKRQSKSVPHKTKSRDDVAILFNNILPRFFLIFGNDFAILNEMAKCISSMCKNCLSIKIHEDITIIVVI